MTRQAQREQRNLPIRARRSTSSQRGAPIQAILEPLEQRQLLSHPHHHLITPDLIVNKASLHHTPKVKGAKSISPAAPPPINPPTAGFFPTEIKHAYGFDQVAQDGTGQTIAIIDAFDNPSIVADLTTFDAQFGLPAIDLTVVNQNGGLPLPSGTDFGWAGETALDVEWAHALAPKAKIILIETRNALPQNLLTGVATARSIPAVSVISMSWGGVEQLVETATELANNQIYFTTPAGHQGITFVASSGDSTLTPVSFPGSSANVLSVGGTSLFLNNGNYDTETSWNDGFGGGSTGGFSNIEPVPYYQVPVNVPGTFRRAVPDVSFNADPATGVAIYDAFSSGSVVDGWFVVGGTSAGAPSWAGLLALSNQQRVAAGKGTLDGFTETLPALYNVYHAPGTAGYASYTSVFHDIDDGPTFLSNPAKPGYDTITGLGTPHVPQVLQTLLAATPATNTTSPASLVTIPSAGPFVTATILSPLPITVAPGDTVKLKLLLKNITNGRYDAPVTINVFTSTSPALPNGSTAIGIITVPRVSLRAGRSRKATINFQFPNNLGTGDYFFFVTTDTSVVTTPAAAA